MAVAFADMHDTPVRMVAKRVLHGIVPWQAARSFLATRLKRRQDLIHTCDFKINIVRQDLSYVLKGRNALPIYCQVYSTTSISTGIRKGSNSMMYL